MVEPLGVILEIGRLPRRIVAAAMDWPGLERWGRDEETALVTLNGYRERYAGVADRAGLAPDFATPQTAAVEVVERVPGNRSTDFWGVHAREMEDRDLSGGPA